MSLALIAAMGMGGGGKGQPTGQQLKAATKYTKSFKKMEFQKGKNMFDKLRSMVNYFGFFGEFMKPFADLMDVFDAALTGEYQEEIEAVNKFCAEGIPIMKKAARAIRATTDGMNAGRADMPEYGTPGGQNPVGGPPQPSPSQLWWWRFL